MRRLTLTLLALSLGTSGCAWNKPGVDAAAGEFTVVLLPDTQYYSLIDGDAYAAQTRWIAERADDENIAFVIHLGDITHNDTDVEWERADAAHRILDDAGVPYSMCPGNHDYPDSGRGRDASKYNARFGPARFAGASWYGEGFEGRNDSNYCTFTAGGMDFLVLSLEFAPRDEHLAWANEVIDAHPNHRVIVATHCYLSHDAEYASCASAYDVVGADGEDIWNELVSKHAGVFAVVSGHIVDSEYRERTGDAGNPVHEILTDYQFEQRDVDGDGTLERHGNGWMRTLLFRPREDRVDVRILTVLDDVTELNHTDYPSDPRDPEHEYSFAYDMHGRP